MTEAQPEAPESDLEVVPAESDRRSLYRLFTGLVIPRPIAWISTRDASGVRNVAPHSYFNVVAVDPPHVVFGSSGPKDTLRNVRESGEFVVNLVSVDVVEPMNFTATNFPPEEDEFSWAGLTEEPSRTVAAPRVAESPAHLECRVRHELPLGDGALVVGEVTFVHVAARVLRDGAIDAERFDPIARLGGRSYARLGEIFDLPRPRWEADVHGTPDAEQMPRRGTS